MSDKLLELLQMANYLRMETNTSADYYYFVPKSLLLDAADEIEKLRKRVKELEHGASQGE